MKIYVLFKTGELRILYSYTDNGELLTLSLESGGSAEYETPKSHTTNDVVDIGDSLLMMKHVLTNILPSSNLEIL